MSQTTIAAYDGSPASRAAVAMAVELAAAHADRVIACHVYPRVVPLGLRGGVYDADLQADLRERGRATLKDLDVEGVARRVLAAGSPARTLHELAVEEDASLLVVGATHHRHLSRVMPGSAAANLLHGAPCAVLVVPADRPEGPIRTIVAAFDEGDQAQVALRRAVEIARETGARLRIVAAFDRPTFAGPAMVAAADLDELLHGDLRSHVQSAVDRIADLDVEAVITRGPAADVVIEAAKDADLIVAGSRGYGPRHAVLVGGVSRQLVDRAPCPVLVVPRTVVEAAENPPLADATAQPA
jgi:nucleotide-binding universal stress UspA family protein